MPPSVDHFVNDRWSKSLWSLGNDDASTAFIQFTIEPIAVEGLVGEQVLEIDAINEWWHADGVVAISGQEDEADKIAQRVCQREDFGCPATFRFADSLILSPPFAPCP